MPTTAFLDSVGGITLTTTGTVTEVTGTFSGAEIAVGGTLSTAASTSFDFTSSFTMAIWVKFEGGFGDVSVVRYNLPSLDVKYNLAASYYGGGLTSWLARDVTETPVLIDTGPVLSDDVWHLMVAYYNDATDELGLSVDGATFITTAITGGIMGASANGTLEVMSDGNECNGQAASMLAFWSRVLSQTEVTALYNEGTFPIKYPFGP